jgi:hypothetical protein
MATALGEITMSQGVSSSPPTVYDFPEKFLASQIREFNKSGKFIENSLIVPSKEWPATLLDVTALLELLQLYADTKYEYVVSVSRDPNARSFNITFIV